MKNASGFSLAELLLVVGLVALIASIAVPAFDKPDEASLDRAAVEVAAALRFARAESIRTGTPYGVHVESGAQRLRVYRLDEAVSPAAVVYDIRDPHSKQLYTLRFDSGGKEAAIASVYFKFDGILFPQPYLGFAAETGVPKYNDSGTNYMLETGYVRVGLDGLIRTVSISPITGRVTVQ